MIFFSRLVSITFEKIDCSCLELRKVFQDSYIPVAARVQLIPSSLS